MSHSHLQSSSAAPHCPALVRAVERIPVGRRAAVLQCAVSYRYVPSIDSIFDIGGLRAAFEDYWETRCGSPVPFKTVQKILEPPIPIATVLAFSKLTLSHEATVLEASLAELIDYLHKKIKEHTPQQQGWLFDGTDLLAAPVRKPLPTGESVLSLQTLLEKGRKFATIYADPPWPYPNEASRGAAVDHYPTMPLDRIKAEPVRELAGDDAHLHLWTTNAFLRESFDVMDAWGFEFKSCLLWVKGDIGMGNYWRVSHEFLLLGVRGRLGFSDRTQRSWVQADRTEHSHKPGMVRTLIERVSPGPYLEMYGREELRDSAWTVYGNQVERRLF